MYNSSGELALKRNQMGVPYLAFIPNPLCDIKESDIGFDIEMTTLLSKAHRALGILEGLSQNLSHENFVVANIQKKESILSCGIDGIDISILDLQAPSNQNLRDVRVAKKYIAALQFMFQHEATIKTIKEIHSILMEGDEYAGQFRTTRGYVNRGRCANSIDHSPTASEDMKSALNDLNQYISKQLPLDPLISAALIHYQFETIHPFEHGNGRVGRILALQMLKKYNLISSPVLLLSYHLYHGKLDYFDRLLYVQKFGDYNQWVKFFIRAIIIAAEHSADVINGLTAMRQEHLTALSSIPKAPKSIFQIYDYLEQHPVIQVRELASDMDISFNTAAKAVEVLVSSDILKQRNDNTRYRSYGLEELIRLYK